MLFLSFWIESVSSVHINGVSHYFYELTFIFFIGICCHKVSYFVLTTSNMYMQPRKLFLTALSVVHRGSNLDLRGVVA